jgi:hypothetical protein
MPLATDAPLTNGKSYTMSMQAGVATIVASVDQLTTDLENSAAVDLASAIQTNKQFFSVSTYDVTFTYTGDGTDTVADVFNEFASALDGWFASWKFIACVEGTTPGTGSSTKDPPSFPTASSLWAIVVIGLIVLFFFSGGASLVRRATG